MRLKDYWDQFKNWLIPPAQDKSAESVDKEYLMSDHIKYRWMTVLPEAEQARCDICGLLVDVEEMPKLVEHVGAHNEHGAAEVDPTELPPEADSWEIEISDGREPAQI
jgi:hypothetical protein